MGVQRIGGAFDRVEIERDAHLRAQRLHWSTNAITGLLYPNGLPV